jgi:hypothetical protein
MFSVFKAKRDSKFLKMGQNQSQNAAKIQLVLRLLTPLGIAPALILIPFLLELYVPSRKAIVVTGLKYCLTTLVIMSILT